jgi:predicted phage replisome organizer
MKINWLKLDVNILNNEKIALIRKYPEGDSLIVLWIGLLCLAMKSDIPGHILICRGSPYSPDDISSLLGIQIKTVKMGLEVFQRFGMIEVNEYNSIEVLRFAEYQSLEEIAQKREATRARVAKHREIRRLEASVTRYSVTDNATEKRREDKSREEKSIYLSRSDLRDYWNSHILGLIKKLRDLSESRYRKYKQRVNEGMVLDEIFEEVAKSSFLRGAHNGRPWQMTYDWLMSNDTNWRKIMEGNYRDKEPPPSAAPRRRGVSHEL